MAAQHPHASLQIRVGQGFDVHALTSGRPLLLGGVHVPHELGLAGHSDGDALLHAIVDAILGAAGLGDIGQHFPSDDPRYAGAASADLARTAMEAARTAGWMLVNVDATVVAQTPRMAPHLPAMRTAIAAALGASEDAVNIKAKTADHLGALGRKEGIAALAVVLLERATDSV